MAPQLKERRCIHAPLRIEDVKVSLCLCGSVPFCFWSAKI